MDWKGVLTVIIKAYSGSFYIHLSCWFLRLAITKGLWCFIQPPRGWKHQVVWRRSCWGSKRKLVWFFLRVRCQFFRPSRNPSNIKSHTCSQSYLDNYHSVSTRHEKRNQILNKPVHHQNMAIKQFNAIVSFQWNDMATLYLQYITYWQFIEHMYWYK